MPVPPAPLEAQRAAPGPGRSLLLLATVVAAVLGLAGCTNRGTPGTPTVDGSGAGLPAVDAAALSAALERETELLGQAVELGLTDAVAVLTTHVAALAGVAPADGVSATDSATSPSSSPLEPTAAALRRQVTAAARDTLRDVPGVTDGGTAALLASVGASDESLAVTLTPRPRSVQASAAFSEAAALPLGARPAATPSATAAPGPTAPAALADAWQASLAGEHAAVYGYGLVGGRLPPGSVPARWSFDAHRARRDALTDALSTAGTTPTPAAAAYVPDHDIVSARDAQRLAASIEQDSLASYTGLVAAGDEPWRATGTLWLRAATLAVLGWSGEVVALPGMTPPVTATDLPTPATPTGGTATQPPSSATP